MSDAQEKQVAVRRFNIGAQLPAQLPAEKCHILSPTATYGAVLSRFDKVVVEVVGPIGPGDTYKLPGGKLALTGNTLNKIATAAGISWHPRECRLEHPADRPRVVVAYACGVMQTPSGQIVQSDSKEIDLDALEEEIRLTQEKNNLKGADLEMAVRTQMVAKRKFKAELAMTGAKLRVIRKFLGLMPAFNEAEITAKPYFVFPRISLDLDAALDDPRMHQAVLGRYAGATDRLFGNGEPAQIAAPAIPEYMEQVIQDANVEVDEKAGVTPATEGKEEGQLAFTEDAGAELSAEDLLRKECLELTGRLPDEELAQALSARAKALKDVKRLGNLKASLLKMTKEHK